MRNYELALVLRSQLSEEEVQGVVEKVKEIVASRGGEAREVDFWGRRKLAYPIEKETEGYYLFISLLLPPEEVWEVSRQVRLLPPVLRHILVREKETKEESVPSKAESQVDQEVNATVSGEEMAPEKSSSSGEE